MRIPSGPRRRPELARAVAQYARRAAHYDLELAPFEPVRTEAIALLDPPPGATVLDVGCGTGLSFAPLKRRIGAQGHIVGIDPSPDMLAQARARIARRHWGGITLLQSDAATAPLHGQADAALFHFTHDVLRDPAALDHVLAHLKPGAPVVACIRKEHVAIRKLPPGGTAHYGGLIGEVRAASFLGADEEYVLDLDGVELRSIQPPIGAQAGDMVEVTIRPENCTVFADGEAR